MVWCATYSRLASFAVLLVRSEQIRGLLILIFLLVNLLQSTSSFCIHPFSFGSVPIDGGILFFLFIIIHVWIFSTRAFLSIFSLLVVVVIVLPTSLCCRWLVSFFLAFLLVALMNVILHSISVFDIAACHLSDLIQRFMIPPVYNLALFKLFCSSSCVLAIELLL